MNADSVAEYVISSSLSLLKKTKLINAKTQSGQWPRTSIATNELKGKILGLIGFGDIAKKVLKLINVFEVTLKQKKKLRNQLAEDMFLYAASLSKYSSAFYKLF